MNGFTLPICIDKDCDYITNLYDKLNKYSDFTKTIKNIPRIAIENIENNCSLIKKSMELYYNADIDGAKKKIYEILKKYKDNSFIVSNLDKSYAFRGIAPFQDLHSEGYAEKYKQMNEYPLSFFKARTGETNFLRKDMLHIPFDKRGVISTQRFSIPGVPCIYLGTTSYVCWLEMGMPEDYKFNVSSYNVPTKLKILNLVISEGLINGHLTHINMKKTENRENNIELLSTMLEIFPLICATSYSIKEGNRKFRSEYIISQLIMQCLNELGIDGVSYISKKAQNDYIAYPHCINLAIPIKYEGDFVFDREVKKYGDLCGEIKLTKPINFSEYIKIQKEHIKPKSVSYINKIYTEGYTSTIKLAGKNIEYWKSTFADFDNYLVCLNSEKVIFDNK